MRATQLDRVEALLDLVSEGQQALVALLRQHLEQVSARSAEDATRAQMMLGEAEQLEASLRAARARFEEK